MRALGTYRQKRNFRLTSEPRGNNRAASTGRALTYVIQKHDARRLHFDLRLELDGVLLSWAVTRGPSLDPKIKRLAVRTEDHPLEYAHFEGTIPKGEYGGGTVLIWDRGRWQPRGDPRAGLAAGEIKFDLDGERLKGGFALIRLKPRRKRNKKENWLLIKERDGNATARDPIERWTKSVTTGRRMDDIATEDTPVEKPTKASHRPAKPPPFAPLQLATPVPEPPSGRDWLHEIKLDGYRVLASVDGEISHLYTRTGKNWSSRFVGVARDLGRMGLDRTMLDGEIVVLDSRGRSDFGLLQRALKDGSASLTYFVFDVLESEGRDLRRRPLAERKTLLEKLLDGAPHTVRYCDHAVGDGFRVFEGACALGLEGIVSKRADGIYVARRTLSWLKCKCTVRDEFVIGGYRRSTKRGRAFASLLLGEFEGDALIYRGRVGTGFDGRLMAELAEAMRPLERPAPPFDQIPREATRDARWVEPRLVAEIAYRELTADGILRHPSFVALRDDKPAGAVRSSERREAKPAAKRRPPMPSVRLTSPDKVLFEGTDLTNRSLATYLEAAAPLMLPHIAGRPLSLVRCPDGTASGCFFQKHRTPGLPREIKTIRLRESDGKLAAYLMVDSEAGIVATAQIGALEIHCWGSRKGAIEKPDRLVFDLDPDPSVGFPEVRRAALHFRDLLSSAGLVSFPLLTGGKGVHVIAPLTPRQPWDTVRAFAKGLAIRVAAEAPDRFTANMSKARRRGRIFVDWLRNDRGSTAIAPFSARARPQASIAMPVTWQALARAERSDLFTLIRSQPPARLPWKDYFSIEQSIDPGVLEMLV